MSVIKRKVQSLRENSEQSKDAPISLLGSTTPEAYQKPKVKNMRFINNCGLSNTPVQGDTTSLGHLNSS